MAQADNVKVFDERTESLNRQRQLHEWMVSTVASHRPTSQSY